MFRFLRPRGERNDDDNDMKRGGDGVVVADEKGEKLFGQADKLEAEAECLWGYCALYRLSGVDDIMSVEEGGSRVCRGGDDDEKRKKMRRCGKSEVCVRLLKGDEGVAERDRRRKCMADDVAAVREKMRVLIRGEEGGRRVSSVDVKANVMQAMSRMFLLHAALRARGEMCAWMNALDSAKVKVMNEEKALLEMEMQSGKKHGTVRGEHGKKNGSDRETETSPRHAERLGTARSRLSMVLNTLDEMEWDQERFKNVPPAAQTHLLSLKRAMVRRVLFVIEARLERGTIHSRERGLAAADATAAASAASTEESSMKGTEAFGGGGGGGDGWGEDANVTCVICAESGSVLVAPCTHRCCKQCWDEWLDRSKSCPMCRRYVHPSQLVDRLRADETLTHIDRIDLTALTRKRHRPRVVF